MWLVLALVACVRAAAAEASATVDARGEPRSSSREQDATYGKMDEGDAASYAALVRARAMPEAEAVAEAPYAPAVAATRRTLTAAEVATFERDGYVVLRGFLGADEVDMLRECAAGDPLILGDPASRNVTVTDATGLATRLTLWWNFGDDSWGLLGRSASMLAAASTLMGGSEPYSSHTKVLLKEPFTGGAWEWHQDFGYWYAQGLTQPDKIVSAVVALDENDRENGAMRVLAGSHRLGRLEHGVYGGQAAADPERVLRAMEAPGMAVRSLALEPGDVAFTHSNLLHCSRPNRSPRWRRNVIVAYNSRHNGPAPVEVPVQPDYARAVAVADGALAARGCARLDPSRTDFLGQDATDAAVARVDYGR